MNMQKLKYELEKHFGNEYVNYTVMFRNNQSAGNYSHVDYFLKDDQKQMIIICEEWY
jgi:hypothetical protein